MKKIFGLFWAILFLAAFSLAKEDLNSTKTDNNQTVVENNATITANSESNTSEENLSQNSEASIEQNTTKSKEQNLTAFIENLYETLLQREADKGGLDFWVDKVESGDLNLSNVIDYFIQSDEFKQKGIEGQELVEDIYQAVLAKSPNNVEIDEAMGILENNGTKGLVDTLFKKDEFINLENVLRSGLHPVINILKMSNQKPFWTNGREVKYVVFDASKSFADRGNIKKYIWKEHSCRGKIIGAGKKISLYYGSEGFHKVALEIVDDKGQKACRKILFEVKGINEAYKIPEPQNLVFVQ